MSSLRAYAIEGEFTTVVIYRCMVKPKIDEATLLAALEDRLRELLPTTWRLSIDRAVIGPDVDAVMTLIDPLDRSFRLNVEVKSRAAPADFVRQLGWYEERGPWLIVAPRIGPRSRELFEQADISWLDPAGDCRIVVGAIVIDRSCPDRRDTPATKAGPLAENAFVVPEERRYVANLFKGKALRVVRWLLIKPERSWRLQDMANAADASIGFVSRTFATLERDAYLERSADGTRLTDRDALLDAWASSEEAADQVSERVSLLAGPEAIIGAIKSLEAPPRYAATAEAAADQIAPFARFSRVDLYVDDPAEWDGRLQLTAVPRGGNLALIVPEDAGVFDGATPARGLNLVSRPQLYVDLTRRGGAAAEGARFLRDRGELWQK